MSRPRWFAILFVLLGVNVTAVLVSSAWHLAGAGESPSLPPQENAHTAPEPSDLSSGPSSSGQFSVSREEKQAPALDPKRSVARSADPRQTASSPIHISPPADAPNANPVASNTEMDLSLPPTHGLTLDGIAEVPSLADTRELERDPIFQEFQKMFGGGSSQEDTLEESPHSGRAQVDFQSLGSRVGAAEKIASAAHAIVLEAARLSQQGQEAQAKRLLDMATSLREIAAHMLVGEF